MNNLFIDGWGERLLPDEALVVEAYRSEKRPGRSCHNCLISAGIRLIPPGPDSRQEVQGRLQAAFVVGFQGDEGPLAAIRQEGEDLWQRNGAGAQGQMGIDVAVIVMQVQLPDHRGQGVEPMG